MTSSSKFSSSFSARKLLLVALVVNSSLALLIEAKALNSEAAADKEPLMATASEYLYQQAPRQRAPRVQYHYVVQHEPQAVAYQAEPSTHHQQPASHEPSAAANGQLSRQEEVSYVLVKSENGQSDTPVEEDCNQREPRAEYLVAPSSADQASGSEGRQDYPGEIVYINQNGEARQSASSGGQQEQESVLSQTSGVPATILTEVPVKNMPYEVLEKLKREYGVKVVATREQPGANLVINCDDYSGQGQTICARQASSGPANQGFYSTAAGSVGATTMIDEQGRLLHRGEPVQMVGQAGPYVAENSEIRPDSYEGQGNVAAQPDSREHQEGFGARTYEIVEQPEAVPQQERPEEASSPVESSAEDKAELRPEGESYESGFETQPEATGAGAETESAETEQQAAKSSH